MGSTSCRNSGSCCRPDGRRHATAELGPTGGETRRGGLGARRAGSGLGGACGPRRPTAGSGVDTARCASGSCPDVGCRTATATARACAYTIVGRFARGGAPRAHVGLARGCAEHCGAASRTIVGSTQAGPGGI